MVRVGGGWYAFLITLISFNSFIYLSFEILFYFSFLNNKFNVNDLLIYCTLRDTLEHYLDKHDPCRCRSGMSFLFLFIVIKNISMI